MSQPAQARVSDGQALEHASGRQYCKAVKVPVIAANFVRLAEQAVKENHSHIGYLEALPAMESEERDRHAIANWLHDAKLPRMKTLEEFEFARASQIPAAKIRELAEGGYITRAEPVVLIGECGTAAAGAAIGGAAEGRKGAAIGAAAGAGAGTVGAYVTGNQEIVLPSETVLTFHVSSVTISPKELARLQRVAPRDERIYEPMESYPVIVQRRQHGDDDDEHEEHHYRRYPERIDVAFISDHRAKVGICWPERTEYVYLLAHVSVFPHSHQLRPK